MIKKIYIAGVGGQGIITAGRIIANAGIKCNFNPVMSEVHGMSQRGGIVVSSIVLDGGLSPLIASADADVLIGFEPLETLRAIEKVKEEGSVILSINPVFPFTVSIGKAKYPSVIEMLSIMKKFCKNIFPLNTREIAEKSGSLKSENAVILGALSQIKNFPISYEILLSSLLEIILEKYHQVNVKAFEEGMKSIRGKYDKNS